MSFHDAAGHSQRAEPVAQTPALFLRLTKEPPTDGPFPDRQTENQLLVSVHPIWQKSRKPFMENFENFAVAQLLRWQSLEGKAILGENSANCYELEIASAS